MNRLYYVVDAFTSERYMGNAAAVVLDADGLNDAEMQSIAAEFNLSETTFVLRPETDGALVRFRWFTPATEVGMCGHATIGGVHALLEARRLSIADCGLSILTQSPIPNPQSTIDNRQSAIRIDTLSGTLTAFVEDLPGGDAGRMIWLDMPTPVLVNYPLSETDLSRVLNLPVDAFESSLPTVKTQDGDALVFVKDVLSLNDARPDFARLMEFQRRRGVRGLCLATTGTLAEAIHVQSRFFAPAVGVDEDPVTGSVHGPLAAYLFRRGLAPMEDRMGALRCTQAAGGRAGLVYALVQWEDDDSLSVRIGGQAVTAMRGTLLA
ncbi:MAG: PhzF family phenazine biosynthesis protein [Planctomycetota bacterium]|jgi:predicted PhzF superfamily epimerase YddE/YHI9